jgi:hypothetical protein
MSKKSKALAAALLRDKENMDRVRGEYPASGGGAPSMPNQEASLGKALGNPVDVHPATRRLLDLHQQGQATHPNGGQHYDRYVTDDADIRGTGVRYTLGDANVTSMGAREAAGRFNGLRNAPNNGAPRVGVPDRSAPTGSGSNGSHVTSQANVSNAVPGKSSSVDALKAALNDLSRRTNGR